MKKFIPLVFFLFFALITKAQDPVQISLSILYNGKAVCDHDITVKAGNATLGVGKTDSKGFVKFAPFILVSKAIDVYGYKKGANGDCNWNLKGYITLDDNYFAQINMETYVNDAAKGSGMPISMFEQSWGLAGLNCDGTAASNTVNNTQNKVDDKTTQANNAAGDPTLLANKQGYQNQINVWENKIKKKENELATTKPANAVDSIDRKITEKEVEELKLKVAERKVGLERINKSIDGKITDAEKNDYLKKEEEMRAQAKAKGKEVSALEDEKKALVKGKKLTKKEEPKKEIKKETETKKDSVVKQTNTVKPVTADTTKPKTVEPEKGKSTTGEKFDKGKLKIKIKMLKIEIDQKEKNLEKGIKKGITPEEKLKKETEIKDAKAKLADYEKQLADMTK